MSSKAVPQFELHQTIEAVYTTQVDEAKERYESVHRRYKELYSNQIQFFARVPIIISFPKEQNLDLEMPSFYACLEHDIIVAAGDGKKKSEITISQSEKTKYPIFIFDESTSLKFGDNQYINVLLCAIKVAIELGINVFAGESGASFFINTTVPEGIRKFYDPLLILGLVCAFQLRFANHTEITTDQIISMV